MKPLCLGEDDECTKLPLCDGFVCVVSNTVVKEADLTGTSSYLSINTVEFGSAIIKKKN